ncbi:MAG: single-stranded-DNA-specific exonuclease RecJ [Syntrophales bacterium]
MRDVSSAGRNYAALPSTRWKYPALYPDTQDTLTRELRIHPVLSRVLINRSISTPDKARKYLSPSLGDLHNPFLLKDIDKGLDRLIKAIYNREKIVIYGDYDADGITSVVILFKFLAEFHPNVTYYIPDRLTEGYSLNISAIDRIKAEGASLIITVDCGISDRREISYAKSLGIDTIILDHHEIPELMPDAAAVINTNRVDCGFPFKHLAGVGIVFNFLIALRGKLRGQGFWAMHPYPNLKEYLDLVAIGTMGDIAPMIDENRIFTKTGLELINQGRRVGIQALKEVSGLSKSSVDSMGASFYLIPRINAAGRMSRASEAVELLLADNMNEALRLARKLDAYNRERQILEKEIFDEINMKINEAGLLDKNHVLVFASPKWHPGIIGIVASKLADAYYRPAILISLKEGIGKGSGRSIAEFNLHKGLSRCHSLLLTYGGHRFAAGISIEEKDIDAFSALLEEIVREDLLSMDLMPQTMIDAHCSLNEINGDLLAQFELLAPFGSMNQEPILCARNVRISSPAVVGNNHLRMNISGDGVSCSSIWFSKGHYVQALSRVELDVAFTPQINNWNGMPSIQLKMRDISAPAL